MVTVMGRLQTDIDIIKAELDFLRVKFELAFRERDFRKLKGLSIWISKLETKLEKAEQKSLKKSTDYIKEYKTSKRNGTTNQSLREKSDILFAKDIYIQLLSHDRFITGRLTIIPIMITRDHVEPGFCIVCQG